MRTYERKPTEQMISRGFGLLNTHKNREQKPIKQLLLSVSRTEAT